MTLTARTSHPRAAKEAGDAAARLPQAARPPAQATGRRRENREGEEPVLRRWGDAEEGDSSGAHPPSPVAYSGAPHAPRMAEVVLSLHRSETNCVRSLEVSRRDTTHSVTCESSVSYGAAMMRKRRCLGHRSASSTAPRALSTSSSSGTSKKMGSGSPRCGLGRDCSLAFLRPELSSVPVLSLSRAPCSARIRAAAVACSSRRTVNHRVV